MIELQNVSKRYTNGFLALDHVNLHLAKGEFAFLTGHSGAGKSTLLKLLAAVETPTTGNVRVGDFSLKRMARRQLPYLRRQLGLIMQTPNLLMDRSVYDNIALPLIIEGCQPKEIRHRVRAVLAKVSLHNRENFFPYELSCGEQQRVAIARAIINKPSLLLADEPTGNLDTELACEVMELFEQFNRLGMTILIVSHDQQLVHSFKHRRLCLTEGKLIDATDS